DCDCAPAFFVAVVHSRVAAAALFSPRNARVRYACRRKSKWPQFAFPISFSRPVQSLILACASASAHGTGHCLRTSGETDRAKSITTRLIWFVFIHENSA